MKLFQSQYDMGFGTKRIPNFFNSNNNIIFSGLECTSKLVDLNVNTILNPKICSVNDRTTYAEPWRTTKMAADGDCSSLNIFPACWHVEYIPRKNLLYPVPKRMKKADERRRTKI